MLGVGLADLKPAKRKHSHSHKSRKSSKSSKSSRYSALENAANNEMELESLIPAVPPCQPFPIIVPPPFTVSSVAAQESVLRAEEKTEEKKGPVDEKEVLVGPIVPGGSKKKKKGRKNAREAIPPQRPLQLPCSVYVQRIVPLSPEEPKEHEDPDKEKDDSEQDNEKHGPHSKIVRVYGKFLYADDPTGNRRTFYYDGVRANSAYVFEFPNLDSAELKEYFARPTGVEAYIRGSDTGKGWSSIYVDVDPELVAQQVPVFGEEDKPLKRRRYTLADFCRGSCKGFRNSTEVTTEQRDNWCLLARSRYQRKNRVSLICELREKVLKQRARDIVKTQMQAAFPGRVGGEGKRKYVRKPRTLPLGASVTLPHDAFEIKIEHGINMTETTPTNEVTQSKPSEAQFVPSFNSGGQHYNTYLPVPENTVYPRRSIYDTLLKFLPRYQDSLQLTDLSASNSAHSPILLKEVDCFLYCLDLAMGLAAPLPTVPSLEDEPLLALDETDASSPFAGDEQFVPDELELVPETQTEQI